VRKYKKRNGLKVKSQVQNKNCHQQLEFRWACKANNETRVEPSSAGRQEPITSPSTLWSFRKKNMNFKEATSPLFFWRVISLVLECFPSLFIVWIVNPTDLSEMFSTKASIKQTGLSEVILSYKLLICSCWREIPVICCIFKYKFFLLFIKILEVYLKEIKQKFFHRLTLAVTSGRLP